MTDELHDVHLVGFPLAVHSQAQEHHAELMREFSLIVLAGPSTSARTLPARLRDLIDKLTQDFRGLGEETDLERDAALAAGLESVDLTYRVPVAAAAACHELREMLDEADVFCRSSDALLTLATPPEARLFRDWYLQEFISQLAGAAPVAWPDYARTAAPGRS